jgi:hypothetical protein
MNRDPSCCVHFDYRACLGQEQNMPPEQTITMPGSEQEQVEELRKLPQLGSPALVGPNGKGRIKLPPSIYQVLKKRGP